MPKIKRKRRPGAGRPPIDRRGSVIAQVRFTQDDWKAITARDKNASKVIRTAVHYWLRLLEKPKMHVGVLICSIAILVRRIEAHTGKTWLSDPATGAAVREEVSRLIECFIPEEKKPPVISPELRQITQDLIMIFAHFCREPELAPVHAGDDWGALAMIAKDLGPALLRKMKTVVSITEVKGRQK